MKIKHSAAREIQYFELEIFSFNSYVYYLTRGFTASTRTFNLPTRAFSLPHRAFNPATRVFCLLTRGFELVTPNSCFIFPQQKLFLNFSIAFFIRFLLAIQCLHIFQLIQCVEIGGMSAYKI